MILANKSFYTLIKLKLRDGTGIFEALTKTTLVIHLPNLYTSHSLRALLQCNHQLLVLPYFKLLFELRSYCCLCTDNQPVTQQVEWDVASTCFYQGSLESWDFFL